MRIVSNLKQQSDYYNYNRRTLGTFGKDVKHDGLGATVDDRQRWGQMRMSPTDIMDVSGATYTFLMNGQAPAANWAAAPTTETFPSPPVRPCSSPAPTAPR